MTRPQLPHIDDYTSGDASVDDDAFEAELFAAAADGIPPDLAFLDHLARISPWFHARGGFSGGATREQIAQLRAAPRVHYIELVPGQVHELGPWPDDTELVASRIVVDLRGCTEVDVHLATPEGAPVWMFRDCQFDANDGNLYGVCDAPLAATTYRQTNVVARVEATKNGRRETIATVEVRPIG